MGRVRSFFQRLRLDPASWNETQLQLRAFWMLTFQAVVVVVVSVFLAFSMQAQSQRLAAGVRHQANDQSAVIDEIRGDINTHARASARRNCAVAKQLDAIVQLSRGSIGPAVRRASRRQLRIACQVVHVG